MDVDQDDPPDAAPDVYETIPDKFGVYRQYTVCPQTDPTELLPPNASVDIPGPSNPGRKQSTCAPRGFKSCSETELDEPTNIFAPFENETQFRFAHWQCTGSTTKTVAEAQRLKNEVLDHPSFNKDDLKDFDVSRALAKLDEATLTDELFTADDGWYNGSVKIPVPMEKVENDSEADAIEFTVNNIYHRKLIEVVKEAFEDPSSESFHYIPFKEFWNTQTPSSTPNTPDPDNEAERMFSEIYNSDAMLEEDANLRAQPREPEDDKDVEYAIAALLPYSDSTRLANFGSASLWPIYLFFGNQSKYFRGKPSCFAAHHLAYLPSLPDDFQDFYRRNFDGNSASDETLRFCKRELMQHIWLLLLDDDFMHAYEHGILLRCGDGRVRRIFPRFFCYSADYPEKVLIACIRYFAQCPCPRCLTKKEDIAALGTTIDHQRRNHVRIDNEHTHHLVQLSRQWMF
ncbi:hypothetical protein K474DRAFT_1602340, partial [Panus rudis PR-1116 ss-1]